MGDDGDVSRQISTMLAWRAQRRATAPRHLILQFKHWVRAGLGGSGGAEVLLTGSDLHNDTKPNQWDSSATSSSGTKLEKGVSL